MNTTLDNIGKLLKMLDNPSIYTEQEIQDIINSNGETRKTYHLMVAAKQGYRHRQTHGGKDTDTSWQQFEQKNYTKSKTTQHFWIRVAAFFLGAIFLTGLSFAAGLSYATHRAKASRHEMKTQEFAEEKMLELSDDGERIIITWLKGTWVEGDFGSYIEADPVEHSPALPLYGEYKATIKLNGEKIDIDNLPDLPASSVNKMEIRFTAGRIVNLITTPVEIPYADDSYGE